MVLLHLQKAETKISLLAYMYMHKTTYRKFHRQGQYSISYRRINSCIDLGESFKLVLSCSMIGLLHFGIWAYMLKCSGFVVAFIQLSPHVL